MAGGLAEDVLLLCWDDEQGVPHRQCWKTVDVAVAGGLVADGLMTGALSLDGGRLRSHGPAGDDPLLGEVVAWVAHRSRPPRVRTVLDHLAAANPRQGPRPARGGWRLSAATVGRLTHGQRQLTRSASASHGIQLFVSVGPAGIEPATKRL